CLEGAGGGPDARAWWPSLRPGQDDWQVMLRSLAELHRSGCAIDWKGFHRPFPHRLVSLPGYPFQRQRYWWSRPGEGEAPASLWLGHILGEAASAPTITTSQAAGGPVSGPLQLPLSWPGLTHLELPGGSERRFATVLSALAPADLSDHRIRRQVVFPAAGFVQLVLQAAQAQELPLAVRDLSLDQPLRLADDTPTELQLVWGPGGIEFHSLQRGPADGASTWRAHGLCALDSAPITARAHHGTHASQHADVAVPRAQTAPNQPPAASASPDPNRGAPLIAPSPLPPEAEALDLKGFYAALEQFGLSYGPAFRTLVSLQRQGDRAWATLQRQEVQAAQPAQPAQDWTLLDGCFQAVAATLDPDAAAGQLFLPVGFEAISLQQLPLPDQLHCQVELRPSDEPAFVLADLLLLPASEPAVAKPEPLGWIRGFRLRRLPRAALDWLFPLDAADAQAAAATEPGPADWLLRAEWEAIPAGELTAAAAATATPPQGLIRASELGLDPLAAVTALLQRAQQAGDDSSWLLLDTLDNPALTGALDGFAKAAALEQGQRQWLRIHLLAGATTTTADLIASLPWAQIQALAPTELALAWDGRQLLRQRLRPLPPERFRFATRSFGLLESLEPQPIAASAPGPGELELAVEATGLNFRDVLNALGLLRAYSRQLGLDEAAQVPFGGECVG
ncbi:MAG: hypothetical protein FJ060_11765, partial [Cyanobacteria bacterium K_Offshore_0m_m2_072]|nr:hypothetical protein [Cyanobacteria bacterium K_Offshore_0m_m2_072]